jgi:sulfate permease, SulP family
MLHLSKPGGLRDPVARDWWEFAVAAIVVAGELTFGVLDGIALGVVLALVMLIDLPNQPPTRRSARLAAGNGGVSRRPSPPRGGYLPRLLIWRAGGELFFASVGHYDAGLKSALAAGHPPAKHVLVDEHSVNFIDTSACDALLNSIKELQGQGITFAFARMRDDVRERMRQTGIETGVGSTNFYERVTDGVHA